MGWGESQESVHAACDRRIARLEGMLREAERRLTWALDWIIDDECPVDSRDYRAARSVAASARALLPDSSPHERRGIKSHLIRDGGRCPRCGALCNELVCMCTPAICPDLGPGALD